MCVLKNLVDIDGKDSDVDLTHWDVSHASNANRAFSNAAQPRKVLSILSTVIAVPLNIPTAFVKLEISQLPMSLQTTPMPLPDNI
jgi:hypothetical protein